MSADIDMNSHQLLNLATPTASTHAVTKAYADALSPDNTALAAAVAAAAASATSASSSATSASTSASSAATSAAAITGTSVTSVNLSTVSGTSPVLVTQASKQFNVGQFVLVASDSSPTTKYFYGQITAYSGTNLTISCTYATGGTTHTDWTIFVSGIRGAAGSTGANGADYTANSQLAALAAFTATGGLMTQTAPAVFTSRTITGTSNLVTVTNGDGVAGNPTLTVGSNVVRKDDTGGNTLASQVAMLHTNYSIGTGLTAGTQTALSLSNGEYQTGSISGGVTGTFTFPTPSAGTGTMTLAITNSGSVAHNLAFSANGNTTFRRLGSTPAASATISVAAGSITLITIWKMSASTVYFQTSGTVA